MRAWDISNWVSHRILVGRGGSACKTCFIPWKGKGPGNILFIFDEPTTGLHFHDIRNFSVLSMPY